MRVLDVGSGNGNHLLWPIDARRYQFAQYRHILRIHRPGHLTFVDRVDLGDLRADVAGWMRTLDETPLQADILF